MLRLRHLNFFTSILLRHTVGDSCLIRLLFETLFLPNNAVFTNYPNGKVFLWTIFQSRVFKTLVVIDCKIFYG